MLSIWGLLWMVGLLASMKVFPHLLDDNGLRIRYGTTADITIPWEAVASVSSRRGSVPTRKTVSVEHGDDSTVLNVAVMKQTRVDVVLHRPTRVRPPNGTAEITGLRFYVDDARAFVARAREHLTERVAAERLANRS